MTTVFVITQHCVGDIKLCKRKEGNLISSKELERMRKKYLHLDYIEECLEIAKVSIENLL
jgi:hypothetical protein